MNEQSGIPPHPVALSESVGSESDGIEPGKRLIRVSDDRGLSLAERLANRLYRLTWRTPLHAMHLKGKYPLKLLAVPDDAILGDPRSGDALRAGHFLFRGLKQPLDTLDFARLDLPAAFVDYIHSFRWLRDLSTVTTREAGAPIAEAIMRKWLMAHGEQPSEPAWRADNAGWRLFFWTAHAPLILSSSDLVYRSLVLNCVARTARHLDRGADKAQQGLIRLVAWGGIIAASLLIPGGTMRRVFGEAGLRRALDSAFHADGGAISRSPATQLEGVMLLSMLRSVYDSRRETVPPFIVEALHRTVAALLGVMHGDNALGSWQGCGPADPDHVAAVVAASGIRTRPLRQARDWGYQRLVSGQSVLLVDAAPPPAARLAEAGCASTAAIEFSDGADRLIINCGGSGLAGARLSPALAQALRTTAAHSTLVLNDLNSTAILPDNTLGRGVAEVELDRQETDQGSRLEISHDGYVRRLGYIHRRLLILSSDGRELRGEDMLIPSRQRRRRAAVMPFVLRFHLGISVEPTPTADGLGVLLRLPSGTLWQFRAGGGTLALEDSLWVDGDGCPQPTQQLVMSGETAPGGTTIGWLMKRVG